MGKTNKSNIQEEERLATELSRYPCLYDKTDKGYKERDRKKNAWAVIEKELGYEEGKMLCSFSYFCKNMWLTMFYRSLLCLN